MLSLVHIIIASSLYVVSDENKKNIYSATQLNCIGCKFDFEL